MKQQVDKMINITHLEDKRHAPANSLSGGMKRKLSVSIALIADSKVCNIEKILTASLEEEKLMKRIS